MINSLSLSIYIYMYIYIYREREREFGRGPFQIAEPLAEAVPARQLASN